MFSKRTEHDAKPNALAAALSVRRAQGLPILDLTLSNPTQAELPYAQQPLLAALGDPGVLRYEPHAFGLPSARAAVQRLILADGFDVPLDRILLTASTSEAYAYLFKLLTDPGDEILLPAPSYPLFEHLARFESVQPVSYQLDYDGAWHIDFESVRRGLTAKTRAIVVVSPNNPTGSFLKRAELEELAKLGLPIISDEVFASYAFGADEQRVRSVIELERSLVFSLGGLSKLAALPQLKLAWTVLGGPAELVAEACSRLELLADTFLSPGAPVQLALESLLEQRHVACGELRRRSADNLGVLRAALAGTPLTVLHLEGGWYAVVRLPDFCDELALVLTLLREDGVLTQPGFFYDFTRGQHLVLSLITPEPDFREGARRLAARAHALA